VTWQTEKAAAECSYVYYTRVRLLREFRGNTDIDRLGKIHWIPGTARLARLVIPGLPHPIAQRGNRRQRVFFGDEDYRRTWN
jgi:hypothetical protein